MGVKLVAALATATLIASAANAADVVTVTDTAPVFEPASTYSFYLGLKGGAGPIIGDNDFTSAPTAFERNGSTARSITTPAMQSRSRQASI